MKSMTALRARPRKTVEDYMKLPDDVRVELIDGEFFMSPSPRERHQSIVLRLARLLADFVEKGRRGMVYIAPFDVHLPSGDVVQPDVIYVSQARSGIIQDWIRGVPDLLIEVLSPETPERDRIVKRDRYAQNGVREYWIVDPMDPTVEIFRSRRGRSLEAGYFEKGDPIVSAVLPGFRPRVGELAE